MYSLSVCPSISHCIYVLLLFHCIAAFVCLIFWRINVIGPYITSFHHSSAHHPLIVVDSLELG